ncbi:uncharacterized protein LOC123987842 [Osmia bicornis bicornis]|uniref:uncharacterized protein LOC123987842 n=1 Tax=Osmia bicornis bicornis TaxID=1437191 RepID=UPI001EAEE45D|nr:uncharacterized protein LOC123987842 [Osmia bicornis bicornis]
MSCPLLRSTLPSLYTFTKRLEEHPSLVGVCTFVPTNFSKDHLPSCTKDRTNYWIRFGFKTICFNMFYKNYYGCLDGGKNAVTGGRSMMLEKGFEGEAIVSSWWPK